MSETQKHTPGPLTAEPRNPDIYYPLGDVKFVICKDAAYTALVCTKADADLYAAAPELLRALQRAEYMLTTNDTVDRRSVLKGMQDAIAKAEGR